VTTRSSSLGVDTGGRPRSERAQVAVLAAARALFEEGGYTSATVEAIAARSAVAKTTIYRWWPNRAALLVDVLVSEASAVAPAPAAGDPLRALRGELRRGAIAANGFMGRLLTSLLGAAQEDPEVRAALLQGLFYPRREASAAAIQRAQTAGMLRSDVPPYIITDMLFGPLFYRMFVQHEPVTVQFVDRVFQYVLQGLQPPGTGRR
jgi:AcrR family transcriptional regulator